ncbi:MAG: NAD(P)H-binding protein [Vicinamibacteria bacterium]
MKVAVTGATGFTGRRVVTELLARGHEVAALVRAPAARLAPAPRLRVVEGDMADAGALGRLLSGAEAFVHAASLGFGHAGAVTEAVAATRPRRSVFFSSTALFTHLPAASKAVRLDAEERVRALGPDWTIVRPTMIYGAPGDRNMERLVRFLAWSPVVPLPGGGRALVQPVHVDDLGRAAVDALLCPVAARRAYNLAGADPAPLRDLVAHTAGLLDRRPLLVSVPVRPVAAALRLWGVLRLPPRIKPEQVLRLAEDKAFSYDDARRDWGYTPRGWREGLAEEVAALRPSSARRS